jgi:Glyoxalase-like domain
VAHGVQIVFDCKDPASLAGFYAQVLHYKVQDPPPGFQTWEEWLNSKGVPKDDWNSANAIVDPLGKGPRIYFQQMDTPKLGKNRLHIDVNASGGSKTPLDERKSQVDAEVDRIVQFGATKQREVGGVDEYCVVMTDPEGNEFCVQ